MSYLVDVLQQVQSLLEVVLVGSSVVVADVQLWRGDREQRLWSYSYHLCMMITAHSWQRSGQQEI